VDTIMLFGNIQVTTQALIQSLDQGIDLALFTSFGKLKGQLKSPKAKNNQLRLNQFKSATDPAFCLRFSQAVTRSKLVNFREILRKYRYNHPDEEIKDIENKLIINADAAAKSQNLDALRGIEGTASRMYFDAIKKIVRPPFLFTGRNRRPPLDPVNALLSLTYTLISSQIQSLLEGFGFDPYIGFYHGIHYGRPSLALDILEEFRGPAADRFVLYLTNQRILHPKDFSMDKEQGCYLLDEPRKDFFREFEKWMNQGLNPNRIQGQKHFRDVILKQAQNLANTVNKGVKYEPYSNF
jgi:CRISPR-associated protein Cas1